MNTAVHSATTCGNCSGVVINGSIDRRAGASMASAAPTTKAIANIGSIAVVLDALYSSRATAADGTAEQEQARHAPPVEAVGHPAADEHQQHGGNELGQPEQADVELVAGGVERLLEEHRHHQVVPDRAERRRGEVATDRRAGGARRRRWSRRGG